MQADLGSSLKEEGKEVQDWWMSGKTKKQQTNIAKKFRTVKLITLKLDFLVIIIFSLLYCQRTHIVDFPQTLPFKALSLWYSSAVCTVWPVPFLQASSCVLVKRSFGTTH